MVWVKVCGVRSREILETVEEAGADAFGLVMARSPRQVDEETARRLAGSTRLPAYLVTVDDDPEDVVGRALRVGAAGVQPHGRRAGETALLAVERGLTVLRPVAVNKGFTLDEIPEDQVPLLDTMRTGLHGGTGERFDTGMVGRILRRWVMAGGLGPDNVADAIAEMSPWGVDASSRLESAPGEKDLVAVRRFVEEAKRP